MTKRRHHGHTPAASMTAINEAKQRTIGVNPLFEPKKAVNTGGITDSGLQMKPNFIRLARGRDESEKRLKNIMYDLHQRCVKYASVKIGLTIWRVLIYLGLLKLLIQ